LSGGFRGLARSTAKGSFLLLLGQLASTLLSALSVIIVANFLGSYSLGEVTIVMVPVNIVILLNDFGVNNALIKFIAQYRYEGHKQRIRKLLEAGFVFNIVSMVGSSLALYVFADSIAAAFLQRPDLSPLVRVASLFVFGQGLLTMAQAILVAYDRMGARSTTQVLWALVKSFAPPLLVWFGLGPLGAVLGNVIAVCVAGALGIAVVIILMHNEVTGGDLSFWDALKLLLTYGFPLYLGVVAAGGLQQLYSVLMTLYVDVEQIGNYNAAANFGALISFFITPLSIALFPFFSKVNSRKEALKPLFIRAVKYTAIITTPIALVLILLADSIVGIIYPVGFSTTALYVRLYMVMYLFQGVGSLAVSALLNGVGETKVTLKMNLFAIVVGVPLSLWLIPSYGIIGMIVTMIIAPRVGLVYGLNWLHVNFKIGFDWRSSLSIYTSSGAAMIVGYAILSFLSLGNWLALFVVTPIFFMVYYFLLLFSGGLSKRDFLELKSMLNLFGPFAQVVERFFVVSERICRS